MASDSIFVILIIIYVVVTDVKYKMSDNLFTNTEVFVDSCSTHASFSTFFIVMFYL